MTESGQPERAIPELQRASRLYRDAVTPEAHAYLASALFQVGRLGSAGDQYRRAIARRPQFADAHANLGFVLVRQKKHLEAHTHLTRALDLGTETAEIHANLGEASAILGRLIEAVRHYEEALGLRPGWASPANNLAWLLATHADAQVRDEVRALRIATSLPRTRAIFLDTLAARPGCIGALRRSAPERGRGARARAPGSIRGAYERDRRASRSLSKGPALLRTRDRYRR